MRKFGQLVFYVVMLSACGTSKDKAECIENPKLDCYCTMEYDPVCGCNGKTYSNACMAECAGIMKYTQGECN